MCNTLEIERLSVPPRKSPDSEIKESCSEIPKDSDGSGLADRSDIFVHPESLTTERE